MNPLAANVEGNMYAKYFQAAGKLSIGHENPVRNRQRGEKKRNSTKTVSLRLIIELNANENITQDGM